MNEVSRRRRVLVSAMAIAVVLTALFGLAAYGLITISPKPTKPETGWPTRPTSSWPANTPTATAVPTPTDSSSSPGEAEDSWQVSPLPETNDPVLYAEAVATVLFEWDTMAGVSQEEYANQLLLDADPSGVEVNGLRSDLDNYYPSEDAWARLREYHTTQRLEVTDSYIPKSWSNIVRDNGDQLPEGAVAVTIEGVRHRDGIVNGKLTSSSGNVAFTVFLACQRGYGSCHLLRLSQLDNPLK